MQFGPAFSRHKSAAPEILRFFLACFFLFLPLGVAAETCQPDFPLETSAAHLAWQGADAAYSIPLPDGRDVWIFGDTLYGPQRKVEGHDPRQVHNSLGISTCDRNGKFHLNFAIKHDSKGSPASYFSPSDPNHWYWAMDGFAANGDLWVTLLCIRHAAKPSPWAFDFETCGSDLAQVTHLDRDPQQWKVRIHPLVADGVKAYPSATTLVDGKFAYLFALFEEGSRPLLATRIPLSGLKNPSKNLEYLSNDGTWKPGFDPAKARPIMSNGTSELSIRYHPEVKRWLAVMIDPAGFTDRILLRSATDLVGPWGTAEVIFHMPEMLEGPERDKNVFCYAGKEHPEFEQRDLVITYVCNTMNVPDLVTRPDIYRPKVVRLPWPSGLDAAR